MRTAATFLLIATLFAVSAYAALPRTINYQGYLKSSNGAPATGPIAMTFSLYSSNPARNNPVWRESQPAVTLSNGTYNVQLGNTSPINLPFDRQYWLGVQAGSDPEMTPQQALTTMPYAMRAAVAESAVSAAMVNGQTLEQLDARYSDPLQARITPQQIATLRWDQVAGSASGKLIPIGTAPSALAFDGKHIWVAITGNGLSAGSLQKVEPATGSLVGAPVTVGVNPQALAFDGTYLWVALKGGDAVAKVNPTDGAVLSSCATGGNGPTALAYDGMHLWVANSASNNVTKINTATCTVTAGPWLVGSNPTALAFDGTSIWVANSGGNTVTKISLDGASKANYSVLTNPVSLAYDGTSDMVWVASRDGNGIVVLDRGTGYPQPPLPAGTSPTAIIFDGVNHWLTSSEGVSKIGNNGIIGTFTTTDTPTALVFDGASIWVAYKGKNAIAKLTSAAVALGPLAVETGNIATRAVIEQTIADGAVTAAKLNLSGTERIGIGTATPNEQLEITGNLRLPPTTATTGIIKSGSDTLIHSYGYGSFYAGIMAGNLSTTGYSNTGTGYNVLNANTTGRYNTASGDSALAYNTTGDSNTASGASTLVFNTIGSGNTASGGSALARNISGSFNTASGLSALYLNTTGSNNTALGYQAGYTATPVNANTTGSNNTFIGYNSGPGTTTQLTNATAIGANALVNTNNSLVLGSTGTNAVNVGIGTPAPVYRLHVIDQTTLSDNAAVYGEHAVNNYGTGVSGKGGYKGVVGTAVGTSGLTYYGVYGSATTNVSPSAGTTVGGFFTASGGASNYGIYTNADKNYFSGKVGIGINSPSEALDVAGNIRITDKDIYLRGDTNHGLGWYGAGKLFSGTNIDGPVLYGWSGGALGTTNGGQKGALLWYNDQRVWIPGNLSVSGTLSKGSGSFKIDHPLDPQNKYLYHSFVESPDMMNIYNGIVVLDVKGEAEIALPNWFEALNKDFRYQLTPIGAPGPNLYVSREVAANSFAIAGGKPGMKVSWQVTGIRKDAFAESHRIPVEEVKPAAELGTCLHPEACR